MKFTNAIAVYMKMMDLFFLFKESHRKTPPWTRPQSADYLSREGSQRRKLAAKFDRCNERRGMKNSNESLI